MPKREITKDDVEAMLRVCRKLGTVGAGSENDARHWAEQVALGLGAALEIVVHRDGGVEIVYRRAS